MKLAVASKSLHDLNERRFSGHTINEFESFLEAFSPRPPEVEKAATQCALQMLGVNPKVVEKSLARLKVETSDRSLKKLLTAA